MRAKVVFGRMGASAPIFFLHFFLMDKKYYSVLYGQKKTKNIGQKKIKHRQKKYKKHTKNVQKKDKKRT
tara:strand:+ start:1838 stop:2044 length:207 start_codon:yes stop_codon:yes gene_type:complete